MWLIEVHSHRPALDTVWKGGDRARVSKVLSVSGSGGVPTNRGENRLKPQASCCLLSCERCYERDGASALLKAKYLLAGNGLLWQFAQEPKIQTS